VLNLQALFVVFEGTDGAGTTTQGDLLTNALRKSGRTVVRTAEPSDGEIGRVLRAVLRQQNGPKMDPRTVALLFAADRVDHCQRVIAPALERGEVVVCDRYVGSSLAFQVADGQGQIDATWVLEINRAALQPALSILIDVPIDLALERIARRGKPRERFEIEEMLARVRARYGQVFADHPAKLGRCVVIDGSRQREAVAYDVLGAVMETLSDKSAVLQEART